MLGMFRGTDVMLLWDWATDSFLEGLAFKQITEKCTGLKKKKKILGNKLLISPGEGNGYPLQYSCLGNPMDRGTCWATVQGVTKRHN